MGPFWKCLKLFWSSKHSSPLLIEPIYPIASLLFCLAWFSLYLDEKCFKTLLMSRSRLTINAKKSCPTETTISIIVSNNAIWSSLRTTGSFERFHLAWIVSENAHQHSIDSSNVNNDSDKYMFTHACRFRMFHAFGKLFKINSVRPIGSVSSSFVQCTPSLTPGKGEKRNKQSNFRSVATQFSLWSIATYFEQLLLLHKWIISLRSQKLLDQFPVEMHHSGIH